MSLPLAPGYIESLRALEMERLRSENERMERTLEHYAKPLTFGSGEHAVFLDVGGPAKRVLSEIRSERP
jgi:hypothetical protein